MQKYFWNRKKEKDLKEKFIKAIIQMVKKSKKILNIFYFFKVIRLDLSFPHL